MTNKNRILSAVGSFFKDLFTKNIGLKIISLLFAFLLWAYVLTIENPEYAKVVRDVEITMTGEEALSDKGYMLVSREIGTTDVTVLCQIGKHSELDASRISCSVDLSSRTINLSEDEDSRVFPLTVTTTLQSGYGTVTAVETSTVDVEVARIAARNSLPVGIEYEGTLPAGFQLVVPERLTISVSGMKSLVDQIAKGMVTVDISELPISDPDSLAGEYKNVYPVQFYNASNVGIENVYDDNGESYTIEVPIVIRAYREVDIEPSIEVGEGYEYTASLSRTKTFIYGSRSLLQEITSLKTETITVLSVTEETEHNVPLILPEGISLANGDSGTVTVVLKVEEIEENREFIVPITWKGFPDKMERGEDFPTETAVSVTGTRNELESFQPAYVTLTVDLTGCGEGTHTLPVVMTVDGRAGDLLIELTESNVNVTLKEIKPEPEPEPEPAEPEQETQEGQG